MRSGRGSDTFTGTSMMSFFCCVSVDVILVKGVQQYSDGMSHVGYKWFNGDCYGSEKKKGAVFCWLWCLLSFKDNLWYLPGVLNFSFFSTASAVVVKSMATTKTNREGVSIVFASLDLPESHFSLADFRYLAFPHLLCPSPPSSCNPGMRKGMLKIEDDFWTNLTEMSQVESIFSVVFDHILHRW